MKKQTVLLGIWVLIFAVFTTGLQAQPEISNDWQKYEGNPLFSAIGEAGSWNDVLNLHFLGTARFFLIDGEYKGYSGGYDGSNWSIGLITSSTLKEGWIWNENNPLMTPGSSGCWNENGVGCAMVIKDGETYKMWYTGINAAEEMAVGYATSTDGVEWTEYARNPVMSANQDWEHSGVFAPYVIKEGDAFKMWYSGGTTVSSNAARIGYANSEDGITWTKHGANPVVSIGPGWESYYVACPTIKKIDDQYGMWYWGFSLSAGKVESGFAWSEDGVSWIKSLNNPILSPCAAGSWDDDMAGIVGVFEKPCGGYDLIYGGTDENHGNMYAGLANNYTVPGDTVTGTWTVGCSPYHVQGDILVPDGETLTIEPGVKVVFDGHYKFNVEGCLLAEGTEGDTIIFTAADPETGWHGIRFNEIPESNDSSKISYCKFTYGKTAGFTQLDRSGGAILVNGVSKLEISHSLFEYNTAIEADLAGGGAIAIGFNASPIICNNIIRNNQCLSDYGGGGGIAVTDNSYPEIYNNYIYENSAPNHHGGGMVIGENSHPYVHNNLIVGNSAEYAGGVSIYNYAEPLIENNTISENNSTDLGGGVFVDDSSPEFRNNIIWGNSGYEVYLYENTADPDFYYCDIENGSAGFGGYNGANYTGTYENNLDVNPCFCETEPALNGCLCFLLDTLNYSPCIDSGDPNPDYNDPEDPDNPGYALYPSRGALRNDIGSFGGPCCLKIVSTVAIEDPFGDLRQPVHFTLFQNYPNPFNPETIIRYQLTVSGPVEITVYNSLGQKVKTLVSKNQLPGEYQVHWDGTNQLGQPVSSGIYIYQLKAGAMQEAKKMVLLR